MTYLKDSTTQSLHVSGTTSRSIRPPESNLRSRCRTNKMHRYTDRRIRHSALYYLVRRRGWPLHTGQGYAKWIDGTVTATNLLQYIYSLFECTTQQNGTNLATLQGCYRCNFTRTAWHPPKFHHNRSYSMTDCLQRWLNLQAWQGQFWQTYRRKSWSVRVILAPSDAITVDEKASQSIISIARVARAPSNTREIEEVTEPTKAVIHKKLASAEVNNEPTIMMHT